MLTIQAYNIFFFTDLQILINLQFISSQSDILEYNQIGKC